LPGSAASQAEPDGERRADGHGGDGNRDQYATDCLVHHILQVLPIVLPGTEIVIIDSLFLKIYPSTFRNVRI
jgi:hypothetical protein